MKDLKSLEYFLDKYPKEVLARWLTSAEKKHLNDIERRKKGPSKEVLARRKLSRMSPDELDKFKRELLKKR